ncbi:MAG: hypothetical protein ACFE68_05650, partial [Candidatus Hodarchaeota archaeon]
VDVSADGNYTAAGAGWGDGKVYFFEDPFIGVFDQDDGGIPWLWLGVGVVVIVAGIGAALLYFKRRKE